jgi:hypothetical protein
MEVIGEVRARHPAQELVRSAEAHHADLIVVGQSGHSAVCGPFPGHDGGEDQPPRRPAQY